jgi:hypothetical protein
MNFYRTGKVIGVTGGVSINLEGAQFKHKALMIPNGSFTGTVQLFGTMYDSNNPSPFPGIFRSVTTNFNGRIVLLN